MSSDDTRARVPVIDGWFAGGDDPALLANRCTTCSTYFFPKVSYFCRNPLCAGRAFEEVALSRRGRLWSWTTNHYPPPHPYVAAEPFVPYTIAAVELPDEQMVVLGQMTPTTDPGALRMGQEVRLVVDTLFTDGDTDYTVWKWDPA